MIIKEILDRGRKIIQEMEELTRQTPPPVSEMEALSAEWRGYCREFLDRAQKEPIERRGSLFDFYKDVQTAIDLSIVYATKWRRRAK